MTKSQLGGPSAPDEVGSVLGERYRLEELVGRGGMASVFRATDQSLGRTVALKIFRADLADADDLRRQRDEITLLAGLNHPGLVTLFDAVADDRNAGLDRVFLVMEFIDGNDLRTRLQSGAIDPAAAALIGGDVADALGYVHQRGVVHRDIKPANILLPAERDHHTGLRAKLADFGIARLVDGTRLTATGSVLGTASYLSPEQAAGGTIRPASDVYSLGLVLIECLSGIRPFPGSVMESVVARLSRDPDVPTGFGPEWERLLRTMTARRPEDRPDASAVGAQLRSLAPVATLSIQPTQIAAADEPDAPTRRYDAASNAALTPPADTTRIDTAPAATLRMPAAEVTPTAATVLMSAGATASATPHGGTPPGANTEANTEAETVRLGTAHPPAAPSPQRSPAGRTAGRVSRRVRAVGVVLAIGVVAVAVWVGVNASATEAETPTVQYPAVEGQLGTNLEQLQRSVAP